MSYTTQIVDSSTGAPVGDTLYTPYACAKVVNEQLEALGRPAGLPGQMFYNYVRQGMLETVMVEGADGKTQKLVRESVLAAWLVGYLERKDRAAAKKMTKVAQA